MSTPHLGPRPLLHPAPPPFVGWKLTGTLNPSMSDRSRKSSPPAPGRPSVYSASVVGGSPETVQDSAPAQSPVEQRPRPAPSKEQPVRCQILAAGVPAATLIDHDCPGSSRTPPPGSAPGHTVYEQRSPW
uniref:Uncharacterized protein n=1 Tax=Oryza nivara TaxID=4536 RepID=A0A0E0JCR7_ORYNI